MPKARKSVDRSLHKDKQTDNSAEKPPFAGRKHRVVSEGAAAWDQVKVRGKRPFTVMLDSDLDDWLEFAAGTTFGYTKSRIVREALEQKLESMCPRRISRFA